MFSINDIQTNYDATDTEKENCIAFLKKSLSENDFNSLVKVKMLLNGDEVTIDTKVADPEKFERIRRITGYLVGTTNRWNNAKKAELKDRVKHAC